MTAHTMKNKHSTDPKRIYMRAKKEMARQMEEEQGYVSCERCGRSGCPLSFHHIVYRSEAPHHENLHDKRNLICLCSNWMGQEGCHEWFHEKKDRRDELVVERELYELFPEQLRKFIPENA